MTSLDYFCREYEEFLSAEFCETIVDTFERVANADMAKVRSLSACKGNCDNCTCNRMDLNNHPEFQSIVQEVATKLYSNLDVYKADVKLNQREWPDKFAWEFLTIKKYKPGGERHKSHSDEEDLKSCKRFITMIIYLTDDFEGGGTRFLHSGLTCNPSKGKLLMFPSAWPWIHEGIAVEGINPKYIMITRLHYSE
ncbi:Oxoglutarate/iron-dependent dioxygenase [uncultured Caudovirales phage]|uniref:Oxoglutarate/iron-dependent dioxygenase n=1 Tax=uncultured Caudovirales phage TaxID=2100421 RepID=A0A6J7X279_9CAUD|nr:Oxoglutarate/iron-dependent dioxygenase [uncultured Caudovirales phage]